MGRKIILILLVVLLLLGAGFCLWQYSKDEPEEEFTEYTPQEEISDEQERQTLVTLYFVNKETGELMPEARLIDVKLLTKNPYATLVGLLLNGPKNDKLENVIPAGTRLNGVKVEKGMAIVDLSEEFIKDVESKTEEESKIVYSIVNTLVELTEIESVKILIDGKENPRFETPFLKMD